MLERPRNHLEGICYRHLVVFESEKNRSPIRRNKTGWLMFLGACHPRLRIRIVPFEKTARVLNSYLKYLTHVALAKLCSLMLSTSVFLTAFKTAARKSRKAGAPSLYLAQSHLEASSCPIFTRKKRYISDVGWFRWFMSFRNTMFCTVSDDWSIPGATGWYSAWRLFLFFRPLSWWMGSFHRRRHLSWHPFGQTYKDLPCWVWAVQCCVLTVYVDIWYCP